MQEDEKIEEYVKEADFAGKKRNWKEKLNDFLGNKYFVPIVIILMAMIAFCLGRVSGLQERRPAVRVLNNAPLAPLLQQEGGTAQPKLGEVKGASSDSSGQVVASKNGTKYHYPWCAGAKQISKNNLITFDSIESARAAGFTPASNCKGLK